MPPSPSWPPPSHPTSPPANVSRQRRALHRASTVLSRSSTLFEDFDFRFRSRSLNAASRPALLPPQPQPQPQARPPAGRRLSTLLRSIIPAAPPEIVDPPGDHRRRRLCSVCRDACRHVRAFLGAATDSGTAPLPEGSTVRHHASPAALCQYSRTCPFCEVIRCALALAVVPDARVKQWANGLTKRDTDAYMNWKTTQVTLLAKDLQSMDVRLRLIGAGPMTMTQNRFCLESIVVLLGQDVDDQWRSDAHASLAVYAPAGTRFCVGNDDANGNRLGPRPDRVHLDAPAPFQLGQRGSPDPDPRLALALPVLPRRVPPVAVR